MKIVKLVGGLGNQMFQYVFGRYIEVMTGEKVYFDDAYCSVRDEDEFSLKNSPDGTIDGYSTSSNEITRVFGHKLNVLSNYFSEDVWNHIVTDTQQRGLYKVLKKHNPSLSLVAETWMLVENADDPDYNNSRVFTMPTHRFVPEIIRANGDVYYQCMCFNRFWFYEIKEIIEKEFKFPPIEDSENLFYKNKIESTNSVGIHIRRGLTIVGWDMSTEWFKKAVKHIKGLINNPEFFIFSDNLKWCEERINDMGFLKTDNITFVKGNYGLTNYVDMQLMSLCKNLIIANCTFSLWSAHLNKNKNKIILSPDQHYFTNDCH